MDPEEDPLLVAEARRAAEGEAGDGPPAEEPMWPAEDPDAVKLSTEEEEALLKVRTTVRECTGRCGPGGCQLAQLRGPAGQPRRLCSALRQG